MDNSASPHVSDEPSSLRKWHLSALCALTSVIALSGELEVIGTRVGMDRTDKNLRATAVRLALSYGAKDIRTPRTLK